MLVITYIISPHYVFGTFSLVGGRCGSLLIDTAQVAVSMAVLCTLRMNHAGPNTSAPEERAGWQERSLTPTHPPHPPPPPLLTHPTHTPTSNPTFMPLQTARGLGWQSAAGAHPARIFQRKATPRSCRGMT